ncbi:hypothetical protein GCM10011502_12660 [Oceanisphaera marina]|uniref:Curlin n=1 Tax=Oceanisphaera marina TaxID=2017550 RepID=A0ABQ1IIL9_9GAMM|nr:hypothetical protein [Oceanisphaera marina]GGB40795.1 hypothetical protein GCM10011502_12660 [Oceanisphaera marina]
MKKLIIAPVAAVVMLGLSGYANASDTGVDIYKHVHITNHIDYSGHAKIHGSIGVNKLGMAVIDSYQNTTNNWVGNTRNTNNANISGGSGNNMAGNGGVNVAAGDNNVQANNTAMTVLGDDAAPDEGEGGDNNERRGRPGNTHWDKNGGASVDAEIGSSQVSAYNDVDNQGNHNNARIDGGSLNRSAGNLGVNVAAGNGNVQANNFALSYGQNASLAVSTVDNKQFTTNNNTTNKTLTTRREGETVGVALVGKAYGSYEGTSVQSNDVYPEIWQGGSASDGHTGGQYWGHMDFDGAPGAGGDSPSSDNDGHFEFAEEGDIKLGIVMVGGVKTYNTIQGRTNVNNAVLSGGSLNGAAGNVGVNVAAGTNNLQSNNMALSVGNF